MNHKTKKILDMAVDIMVGLPQILVLIVALAGVFLCILSPEPYNVVSLNDGWTDAGGHPVALDSFYYDEESQMLPQRIYRSIQVSDSDTAVIFRCRNCYANVYINGEPVYRDKVVTRKIYGSSPGSRWHVIALGSSKKPIELCLEVTACYSDSNGLIDNIYLGPTQNVYRKVTASRITGFVIGTFLHLVSIIILVMYAYLKKHYNVNRDLLYLGMASFFSAQWSSTESLLWQLFVGYSEVFHLIGYLSLVTIPLGFGLLSAYRLKGKLHYLSLAYSLVSAANLVVTTILHVTGTIEFHYLLSFTHVLTVLLIPIMIMVVLSYTKGKEYSANSLLIITLLIILIVCLATALIKYRTGSYGDYSGYIRIAILCFLFCLIMYQVNQLGSTFSKGLKADMLHDMALTDHMTGLYNRTAFNEHKAEYNHMIDSFSPLGIIQFDVNNLKTINDTLGHEKGDQMIKAVADGLKLAFGENCRTYRTGGDEFLTIISSMNPDAIYQEGIKTLKDYCRRQNKQPDSEFRLHIAHGYVVIKGNMALSEAIDEADALMYENKRALKQQPDENE
ncbi:MAG: GGDEF domain-containing protein [Lachnospiraceae bacterium]|nr:GGDEF domain-containing protein [Lachnospiraceae bacterium]